MPPAAKSKRAAPAGELALIANIRARVAAATKVSHHLRLGIGDDCAILTPPPHHELLITTDLSLEGRHFRRDWHSPASIGHRTLARGLSDLAAMGAKPLAAFLSLALPKDIARDPRWLNGFLDGLLALAAIHHVPLAGGDTSESPNIPTGQPGHILADITLLGAAPRHRALRRSTARPGDLLYVTGALGGASIELAALSSAKKSEPRKNFLFPTPCSLVPVSPHLFPTPRIAVGRALLRRRLATACIDLSDGLSTDLTHLCAASHVAAEVDAAAIPLHPLISTLTPEAALHAALHGGEDYELLFTAAPSIKIPHSIAGIRVSRIGRIVSPRKSRPTITLIDSKRHRTPLEPGGWEHLQ